MNRSLIAFVVLLTGVLSGCSSVETCGSPACAMDARISADVQARLNHEAALEVDHLRVQTVNQVVYLYGLVDTQREYYEAEDVAGRAPGVKRVVNLIGVANNPH